MIFNYYIYLNPTQMLHISFGIYINKNIYFL